ncbi:MAG TPA: site-2 protease family protein, partial [Tepidisphaeraceae bacterium]|nr:site-2 protease family protein [Tepidisphaeraceae bacterium]
MGTVILLVLGFGFVIFWHELGHFLAAKWAGVKVEQFAVGFGQALISWRKGLGFRLGSSRAEYEQKLRDYLRQQDATLKTPHELADASASEDLRLEYAATQLGLGETEYRLNWIPLGGYVKMLGQDDMNPNATSEHPRAYNNKSIGKRMVIVSAGVIMNVILAIILFAVLFRIGFNVPPPVVGSVATGSPAQRAGIQVGDRILTIDGVVQHDFTKISMNVALVEEGQTVPVTVRGVDGVQRTLKVTPQREAGDVNGFLKLGISPAPELRGLDPRKVPRDWEKNADLV